MSRRDNMSSASLSRVVKLPGGNASSYSIYGRFDGHKNSRYDGMDCMVGRNYWYGARRYWFLAGHRVAENPLGFTDFLRVAQQSTQQFTQHPPLA